ARTRKRVLRVAMRVRGLRCLPPDVVFILERRFMIRKKGGGTSRQPNNETQVLSASRILRRGCAGGPSPCRQEKPCNRAGQRQRCGEAHRRGKSALEMSGRIDPAMGREVRHQRGDAEHAAEE